MKRFASHLFVFPRCFNLYGIFFFFADSNDNTVFNLLNSLFS